MIKSSLKIGKPLMKINIRSYYQLSYAMISQIKKDF